MRWRLDQTTIHMRWKAGCARKHLDMAYLAWTRTGQKGKVYPAHFLSQRTFMLTPLPQASCKVSFQPRCYSLFSGQVPYVWIIFMKHSDLLTPWKLRDHRHFRSTGVSRLISGFQNNPIVVTSCTRTLSMSRFMLWYNTAGILHLNFQGKIS